MPLPKIPNRPPRPEGSREQPREQTPRSPQTNERVTSEPVQQRLPRDRSKPAGEAKAAPLRSQEAPRQKSPVQDRESKLPKKVTDAPQARSNNNSKPRVQSPKPAVKDSSPKVNENQRGLSRSEIAEGYVVDSKTGKKYIPIPKSEYNAEGIPILQLEDFDADDMNSEAERFLAHLRVAPDKKEQARLREEKIARKKQSDIEYKRMNASIEDDD